MRTIFLSASSLVLAFFAMYQVSAQNPDGTVEQDPSGDAEIYEYDSIDRQVRKENDDVPEDTRQYYDEHDRIAEEPEAPGGSTGGSVDPLNNPEAFEKCPDCKSIQDKIDKLDKEIKDLEKAEEDLNKKQSETESQLEEAKKKRDEDKEALEDFDNPKSYAESEGDRVDSSDLAAKRWAFANTWGAYQNGDMTASELEDFWEDFGDEDLEKAKEGYRKHLEKNIENAEKAVKDLEAKKEMQEAQAAKLKAAKEKAEAEKAKLQKELEDCLKKCSRSIIDSFFDIFYQLPDAGEVLKENDRIVEQPPYQYDGLERLKPLPKGDFNVDSFFDIFTEIDLPEDPNEIPPAVEDLVKDKLGDGDFRVDSFFDIFTEIDFTPPVETEMVAMDLVGAAPIKVAVCPKCQSILDKINAKNKEITALQNTIKALGAKAGKLDEAIGKAKGRAENLKDALDRMENPRSWAESEGRRVDSADLEARRAAFADAWGQYRAGNMTAQELENYWENFDDAERDKWKEKIKAKLKEKINDAENVGKQLKADKAKVEAEIKDAKAKIEKVEQERDQLQKDYEECIKKCKDATTPPSIMDQVGGFWDGIFGPRPFDIEKYLEETLDLLVGPPIVLPASGDDIAPEDEKETESRTILYENLDIYVPKGETVEFTVPMTPAQREYFQYQLEDIIISETSDSGNENEGVVVNPEVLLPKPELSKDNKGNLVISNIGSSGEDGVRIDLDDVDLGGQVLNPNPNGQDILEGSGIDTSGIGDLGSAQVIGFDEDGKQVVLRDNVRIVPESNGGARITFDSPITVSPGSPVDIIIPAQITNTEDVEIELPRGNFVPSDNNPYQVEAGPEGGILNGDGVSEGTGNIFLPPSGSPEPPIFRFDPDGNLNPNRDLILPDNWNPPIENPFILPPPGFDPLFDLGQGLGQGNADLDPQGNLIVSNIGSSGQDGVRIDVGEPDEGFAEIGRGGESQEGGGIFNNGGTLTLDNYAQIGHRGAGTVNVNPDGTFTYDPPAVNAFGTDTFDYQIQNTPEDPETPEERNVDFFRPLILEFPDDLGRSLLPELNFGIVGPSTFIPVDPTGLDGKPGLSPQDFEELQSCLEQGGSSCNGLEVGSPVGVGGTPFGGTTAPGDFEFIAGPPDGQTFDWNNVPGNEGGGLWNADGPTASQGLTDSFFDIDTGVLQGSDFNDQGGGGIFNNGGGIFNEGTNNGAGFNFFGNGAEGGIDNSFLPGPPTGNEPLLGNPFLDSGLDVNGGSPLGNDILEPDTPPAPQSANNLPPQVQALIRRIIQQNPPGPCDELIIDVTRVRVGTKYEFTITARMRKKPNCPPKDDIIIGDPEDDTIIGEPGDDVLLGEPGRDTILGEPGNDNLLGGNDPLLGGGNDRLDGGGGLIGGPSDDIIPGAPGDDIIIGNPGNDIITDGFESGGDTKWNDEEPETEPEPQCRSNADCDDGDPCTEDFCRSGNCVNPEINADDGDECTTDYCENGQIINAEIPGCRKQCPTGSFERASCTRCDAGCEAVPNIDNLPCYKCKEPEDDVCVPDCYGKMCGDDGCGGSCGQCGDGIPCNSSGLCEEVTCPANSYKINGDCASCPAGCTSSTGSIGLDACTCPTEETPQCPSGTTSDRAGCNEACSNGVCLQTATAGDLECVQCYQCPSDMFTDQGTCESSSGQACEVGATSGSMQCWKPMPSCEDACAQHGFSSTPIDFTTEVESQLNAVSCVSSYQMQIQQARVGNCECHSTQPPQISFDRTPPVCKDTVCGDVACGNSASCQTGPNQTTTVTCNWGGWQKEALYKYKPILGGN